MVFVRRRKGVLCWDCARERTFTANGPALGPGIEERHSTMRTLLLAFSRGAS
jgi:hypothetical protein